jgi:D-3-phosphoglycerate dehydrogenase
VLVCDSFQYPRDILASGAFPVELATLLAEADYVSLHAPLTEQTRGLIGREALERMKPSAILVNTSRGPIVQQSALAEALRAGRIAYAGLDVFEREPVPADSPLRALSQVVLSDHTGYYSEESLEELKTKAAQNVVAVLKGGQPIYPVNQLA